MGMIDFLYDGSFSGLLTIFYQLLKNGKRGAGNSNFQIYSSGRYQQDLFSEAVIVETDTEKAEQIYRFLKSKLSSRSLKRIYYTFLSEIEGIEVDIYHYLVLGIQMGMKIDSYYSNSTVFRICEISRKVGCERHRLLGLLRFKKIKGDIYYAALEPDHNVISLISPHFASRLADQKWIIHDLKRKIAAIYKEGEWFMIEVGNNLKIENSGEEVFYQELWKGFFKSIAIDSRKNSRQQKQYMPVRYWKHLVEKE